MRRLLALAFLNLARFIHAAAHQIELEGWHHWHKRSLR